MTMNDHKHRNEQSVDLRRAIQWRNMKLKLVIGGMGVAFLLYIVAMIAG